MATNADIESLKAFSALIGVPQAVGEKAALKVSDDLVRLWQDYDDYVRTNGSGRGYRADDPMLPINDMKVTVDVTAEGSASALLNTLKGMGLEDGTAFGKMVSGQLPISSIDDVAKLAGVKMAMPAYAVVQAGSVESQGDIAMNADDARAAFAVNGAGVKIGVMSDSFDTGPGSYATDRATGDLPSGVAVLSDYAGGSDEGRAMAQLAYDVAPGSTLAFHTAFNGQADFAQGIIDLKNAGATVVTDDVIYFAEPMFMDGTIAKAVDTVKAAGVSYFSSAGNQAVASYEAPYRAAPTTGFDLPYNFQSLHDFNPSSAAIDCSQSFTLAPGASIFLTLQWADPFISHSSRGATTDIDALIYDSAGTLVTGSYDYNIGGDPVEIVGLQNGGSSTRTYQLVIGTYAGATTTNIKYVDFGDANFTEYRTNSGASYGHASAEGGEGVGAAYYGDTPPYGTTPPELEGFSSVGGAPILFDGAGNRLAAPVFRDRVDITAPDGTDTTFFGFDSDGNGRPNFFGTSAAAPHAAGVAALLLDAKEALTPSQVYDALEGKAIDMDNPYASGFQAGKDVASGYGLIDAYAAVQSVLGGGGGPTEGDDIINGTEGPDTIFALGGNDIVYGKGGDDYLDGGLGTDTLYGDAGNDKLFGQSGNDRMYGGTGNDELGGQDGNDTMYGGAGLDKLGGGTGNDLLYGDADADVLSGREGLDRLTGGGSNDTFQYWNTVDSRPGSANRDVILDFVGVGAAAGDRIDLATIDANTTRAGDQAFVFRGTATFTGAGQVRVLASGADTLIQANTGGSLAPEMEILVKDGTALHSQWVAGDFIL